MKYRLLISFIVLTAGCQSEPSSPVIKLDLTGNAPVVMVSGLSDRNDNADLTVRLFPKYESAKLIDLGRPPEQIEPGAYKLFLPQLPPGKYRIVIQTDTTRHVLGIPLGHATRHISHDFIIHPAPPKSCFGFDAAEQDTMGWSTSRVYLSHDPTPVSGDTCPGLFYVNISWPHGLKEPSQGGSLFVPVSSECFPRMAIASGEAGLWRFRIISPELSDISAWQGIKAIQFKMASKSIPILVAPEIEYQLGKQILTSQTHARAQPKYQINNGRWNNLQYPFPLPDNAIVRRVIFNVYGQPEKTVTDKVDSIFIDAICPVQ